MHGKLRFKKLLAVLSLCRINELGLIIPFAVISALMLCGMNFNLKLFLFVVIALSCGFMAGCAFNGLSDKDFDAKNPRTSNRPMVLGKIKAKEVSTIIAALSIIAIIFTALISPFLLLLLPIPAALCFFYSLSKRYTWLCHILIGVVHAIAPVSVAIIFDEIFTFKTILITAVVVISTTETDLLYSIQDAEYDAKLNLKSIPAVFGIKTAMAISFLCYLISLCVQVLLYINLSFVLMPIIVVSIANLLLLNNHILMYFNAISSKRVLITYQIFILLITAATMINLF